MSVQPNYRQGPKTPILQLKCEGSIAVWLRDMEDNQGYNEEDPDIHQQLPEEDTTYSLARDNNQQGTLGEDRTDSSRGRNQATEMEMDRPHPQEKARHHYKTGPDLEPPGKEEKRKTKKQLEKGP